VPTRILLIEDNPGDAIIFREKLNDSDLDYELVHTERLREGLELIGEAPFDIIFCDLSLPDASGLQAVVKVRRAAPDQPLIVLTGLDDATAAATARSEGAIDYLVKWYQDGTSLARYIRYAIAQGKMMREGRAFGRPAGEAAGAGPEPAPTGPAGASGDAPAAEGSSADPELLAEPRPERNSSGDAAPAGDLQTALDAAKDGIAVVAMDRRLLYSNRVAREIIGSAAHYPWAPHEGEHTVALGDLQIEQVGASVTWKGAPAVLLTLRREVPPPESGAASPLAIQIAQAAYAFTEGVERRSAWMTDLVRSAVDLEKHDRRGVVPKPQMVNLVERVQQAVREQRALAMGAGLPVNIRTSRDKVVAQADRALVDLLVRRLLLNALLASETGEIGVEVRVEGPISVIEVEWEPSEARWSSIAPPVRALSRSVTEHIVDRLRGTCSHGGSGAHSVVSVKLPAREAPGATP
jgi:CheY-like chemotaxis protein